MNYIVKRLKASLACGAVYGDDSEQAIVSSQIREAIVEINRLEGKILQLEKILSNKSEIVLSAIETAKWKNIQLLPDNFYINKLAIIGANSQINDIKVKYLQSLQGF